MSAYDNATKLFHACESMQGWAGCKEYATPGATFAAQSEPLVDIKTLDGYCEWMAGAGKGPLPGATYELHAATYDEKTRTAMFFATFIATHTGEGGPVPPTNKTARTEYVYICTMNADGLVEHMVKVWNAPWAMRQLGWA